MRIPILEHFSWQEPVLEMRDNPPALVEAGDRFIVNGNPSGAWGALDSNTIVTYIDSSNFITAIPKIQWRVINIDDGVDYFFDGDNWLPAVVPDAVPPPPVNLSLNEDGDKVEIQFDVPEGFSDYTHFEVWTAIGEAAEYGMMLAQVPIEDVGIDTTITVFDTTYPRIDIIYYRIFCCKNKVKSEPLEGSIALEYKLPTPTGLVVRPSVSSIHMNWDYDESESRLYQGTEIYVDAKENPEELSLGDANKVILMKGNYFAYTPENPDMFFKVWLYTRTRGVAELSDSPISSDAVELSDIDIDALVHVPASPTDLILTEEDDSVRVKFNVPEDEDIYTHFEIWTAIGEESEYGLISQVPKEDVGFETTIEVVDNSYDRVGRIYYRIYCSNNKMKSEPLQGHIDLEYQAPDPTNVLTVPNTNSFNLHWLLPDTRLLKEVVIKMHTAGTSEALDEELATEVYRGLSTSFTKEVLSSFGGTNFHQFWAYSITRSNNDL